MGLAGLYLSGYGAHAFYELIPRGLAGLLMVIVTVSAVTLAVRLDTRLLATLAWLGAYLTPMLLSTGEDRALSLYAYLLFLAMGALAVDGLKAWGETAPLAFAGTVLLYGGWYGQHYRAERFEVAALGVALFTAVFGLALARQRRPLLTAIVGLNAAFWITTMAADHGRPEWLLAMSLALACAWAWQSRRLGLFVGLVGLAASTFPYLAWLGTHQPLDPDWLGFATLWLVGGVVVFLWPDAEDTRLGAILSTLALGFAGFAAIGLAATVDRPLGLLALLLALTGLAIVLRPRFSGAELIGALSSALAVAAWIDRFYRPERSADALLLALPVGLAYLLALGARVLLGAILSASRASPPMSWRRRCSSVRSTRSSGSTRRGCWPRCCSPWRPSMAFSEWRRLRVRVEDGLARGTAFGLAIAFLTLAIPVWLGLHAITLAWAIEGAMLLGLGARYGSRGVRRAGYAVAGLAVIRLLVCHLPLHSGHFVSVLNASFGTWLFVIAMLASGIWLTRAVVPEDGLEGWLRSLMAATAIVLLFVALTTETQDTFAQWARGAEAAGHFEAARFTRRAAGLGLSVLWTLFATGLLAGGLAARSRALYYAGYALFGFTALKVVFVDLATFPTLLRMFSFLALAVLLTAGAYLNLRFRARLAPVEDAR